MADHASSGEEEMPVEEGPENDPKLDVNKENDEKAKELSIRDVMKQILVGPTPGQIQGLEQLFRTSQLPPSCNFRRRISEIISVIQRVLDKEFNGGIKVHLFGSFLTYLNSADVENDLNLFIEFYEQHNELSLGTRFNRIAQALQTASVSFIMGRVVRRLDWVAPVVSCFATFPDVHFCVNCAIGVIARQAYLSSKLMYAYLVLWPSMRPLALFVRSWASLLKLNVSGYGGVSNHTFDIMVIYYLQLTGYLPILHEILCTNEVSSTLNDTTVEILCSMPLESIKLTCRHIARLYYGGDSIPQLGAGQLIYGFFRYYATEFDTSQVCQITQRGIQEKNIPGMKNLIIQDPFTGKNVAKFRHEILCYFENALYSSAFYFCVPRIPTKPVYAPKISGERTVPSKGSRYCTFSLDKSDSGELPTREEILKAIQPYRHMVFNYSFIKPTFMNVDVPPIRCFCCSKSHREFACPLLRTFYPISCKPMKRHFVENLTKFANEFYETVRLSKNRQQQIALFISDMQNKLRVALNAPELEIVPFGSLLNGFACDDCDLDLFLRLRPDERLPDNTDDISKDKRQLFDVVRDEFIGLGFEAYTIIGAKVPIVKFWTKGDFSDGFKGDVSCDNSLAKYNSDMLATYCKFDDRVPRLGIMIKKWAKSWETNEASTGTISSYALIVMMIHSLQVCKPPVLPYLQEVAKTDGADRVMYEDFDVTFSTEIDKIKSNGCFTNKESVGQLFFNFLLYYCKKVDYEFDVIQIRCPGNLSKLDKDWCCFNMCVEDPFELSHNLTRGVKTMGFSHIMKCFKAAVIGLREIGSDMSKSEIFKLTHLDEYKPSKLARHKRKRKSQEEQVEKDKQAEKVEQVENVEQTEKIEPAENVEQHCQESA
ncbi:cid1 family poly A polymerase domain-containing protein [Ditylenchus destructor]|nr:cid1 family poly A polymerase domain-containing protein [Ditylenchus destructor]